LPGLVPAIAVLFELVETGTSAWRGDPEVCGVFIELLLYL
jgi:hypothetical protein